MVDQVDSVLGIGAADFRRSVFFVLLIGYERGDAFNLMRSVSR